jgi:hypothetical protein
MTHRTGLVASSSLPLTPFFSLLLLGFVFALPAGSFVDFAAFLWVYLDKQPNFPFIEPNYPGALDPVLGLLIFMVQIA